MNRVPLFNVSNEDTKSYRRQTTNVVNYPNYLKHVKKKLL